jgi:hypothetical protein
LDCETCAENTTCKTNCTAGDTACEDECDGTFVCEVEEVAEEEVVVEDVATPTR